MYFTTQKVAGREVLVFKYTTLGSRPFFWRKKIGASERQIERVSQRHQMSFNKSDLARGNVIFKSCLMPNADSAANCAFKFDFDYVDEFVLTTFWLMKSAIDVNYFVDASIRTRDATAKIEPLPDLKLFLWLSERLAFTRKLLALVSVGVSRAANLARPETFLYGHIPSFLNERCNCPIKKCPWRNLWLSPPRA